MNCSRFFPLLLVLALSVATIQGVEPNGRVELGTWHNTRQEAIPVAEWREGPIVVAFLGTECPLAKQYAAKLEVLQQKMGPRGVRVVGVMSNAQDSAEEIDAFATRLSLTYPLAVDEGARIADQFEAERTPEFFLLDTSHTVRYRGRFDDQFRVGVMRDASASNDLADAIEALLARKEITTPRTDAAGCIIGRPKKPKENAKVTYGGQIASLLQKRCVDCHRPGEVAPFSLTDYESAKHWADMIGEVVATQRMPPWHANPDYGHFVNNASLTTEERELIAQWVADGAPAGDLSAAPPPKQYVEGWQLPRAPDMVIPVNESPFEVAATGEVRYQYFRVDTGLQEDRWVEMAELLPGNRAVVHHILAFVRPKGSKGGIDAERSFFTGYVPGLRLESWPKGYAKRLPANSELIFQVHYTPIGSAQKDRSQLGLLFCDPSTVTHEVVTSSAVQPDLKIPPNEPNYGTSAVTPERFSPAYELLAMAPHMHLRGKDFRYELLKADGQREILLDVPHFDFNWQHTYMLAEPRKLPEGSRILCTASFDNSSDNPHNPDPSKWVRWGDQTRDEMMIGYFHMATPVKASGNHAKVKRSAAESKQLRNLLQQNGGAAGILKQFDRDQDGSLARSEVPRKHHTVFDAFDTDGDQKVTLEELNAVNE